LTGNLNSSLDYIVQTEYGNKIYTEYGIGGHGSKYHVGRNSNLPKGYRTNRGLIKNENGDLLFGFVQPGTKVSGDHILGSEVFISKNVIYDYYLGDQSFGLEQVKHEFFHLKDYFSGNYFQHQDFLISQGISESDLSVAMTNWIEFRAYSYNYQNTSSDFWLIRKEWYSNLPWDMFWSSYGY